MGDGSVNLYNNPVTGPDHMTLTRLRAAGGMLSVYKLLITNQGHVSKIISKNIDHVQKFGCVVEKNQISTCRLKAIKCKKKTTIGISLIHTYTHKTKVEISNNALDSI